MSDFVRNVVKDMRHGRESWRVYVTLWSATLAVTLPVLRLID